MLIINRIPISFLSREGKRVREKFMKHSETNNLFPIFLKLEDLRVLLIGAGNVGSEKLQAIVSNAPKTRIKVVAKEVSESFSALANQYSAIEIITAEYNASFLDD